MLALIPFLAPALAILSVAFPSVVTSLLSIFGLSLSSTIPLTLGLAVLF